MDNISNNKPFILEMHMDLPSFKQVNNTINIYRKSYTYNVKRISAATENETNAQFQ